MMQQDTEKVNILLVDDRPENLFALQAMLEHLGQHLVQANSGEEALKLVLSHDFAVILMDVQMPTIDGFETAMLIKQREKSRHIPIIFLTAIHYSESYIFRGYELGAVDYLAKPIVPEILSAKVQNFIELHQARHAIKRQSDYINQANAELEKQLRQVRRLNQELKGTQRALQEANESLEDRIRERTAELEAANRELETFNYTVSHDLRAPLRIINGFSKILTGRYADELNDDARDLLHQISDNTVYMGSIIENLLSFSRTSRAELRQAQVDLSQIATNVLSRLQMEDQSRSVQVVIAEGAVVEGDAMLLEIMLTNLLGNAWKFTSKQPDPVIEFGMFMGENAPVYYVRDNGIGFDMEKSAKLFAPFQRLHATAEFPGTGIGLATVKRIMDRHHGHIRVESVPGDGTTFYFDFPPLS
jgi:two-component system, sensor histidine kinase and response regulator